MKSKLSRKVYRGGAGLTAEQKKTARGIEKLLKKMIY